MKASKWMGCLTLALAAFLLCPVGLMANNIRIIGTPEVVKKDDKKTAAINFTLAWDNSWKSSKPANWDAAWIYVKCWDGDQWNHVYLEDKGHTPGNKDLPGYRVQNRDKSSKNMPMTYECGKSVVWKKWHVNPDEDSVIGVVGIFLYRKDSLGAGDVVIPGISLLWNYSEQNFTVDDDLVVKVFAVEMVYVPQGAYYLGGKGTAASQVASFTTNAATFGTPMYVDSEKAIALANDANPTSLWSIGGMAAGSLPEAFPKGFKAFYIMKYELTQEAYADFLNTLNQGQQDARIQGTLASIAVAGHIWGGTVNQLAPWRNYIEVMQRAPTVMFGVDANNNGNADSPLSNWNETVRVEKKMGNDVDSCDMSIDGQDLACNFVSMYDLLAYADFAGLRPMTELEYEKACRGDRPVVNDEFAWGSVTKTYANMSQHTSAGSWFAWNTAQFYNINTGAEQLPPAYNCGGAHGGTHERSGWWNDWRVHYYGAVLRVGCFADSTSTRAAAGATYWGVMNMSDNCSELCISVGNSSAVGPGRNFVGEHGDGQLLADGNANVRGWAMVTTASYFIPRGMGFGSGWTDWVRNGATFDTYKQGNYSAKQNVNAGMVSSRAFFNHGVVGTTREHGSYMSGIRCVRTADAAK